jgi:hypothetical protein
MICISAEQPTYSSERMLDDWFATTIPSIKTLLIRKRAAQKPRVPQGGDFK